MTTTDLSKKQLATILCALDDAPRNPANRGEALRAIGRSAQGFGLTAEDVLGAAAGLLDRRPADFRVELQDQGGTPVPATEAPQEAPETQEGGVADQGSPRRPQSPHRPPRRPSRPGAGPSPGRRPSPRRLRRPTSPRPAPAPSRPS